MRRTIQLDIYNEDDEDMTYETTPNPDAFTAVWQSSKAFYERFDVYPPDTDAQLRCVAEEYLEFVRAVDRLYYSPAELPKREKDGLLIDIRGEAADVIVTMMGVLMGCGVTLGDLQAAMLKVAAKNDAKIPGVTHAINEAGKIARIVKAE